MRRNYLNSKIEDVGITETEAPVPLIQVAVFQIPDQDHDRGVQARQIAEIEIKKEDIDDVIEVSLSQIAKK